MKVSALGRERLVALRNRLGEEMIDRTIIASVDGGVAFARLPSGFCRPVKKHRAGADARGMVNPGRPQSISVWTLAIPGRWFKLSLPVLPTRLNSRQ